MITAYIDTFSNGDFQIIDLGDTDVIMKDTYKDLQDISKVFSPYSLDFTLPPTDKNKKRLDWFGYNDMALSTTNTNFKFPFKIYLNDILHLSGFFACKSMTVGGDFVGKFETGMSSLKDTIGEALISDLPMKVNVLWNGSEVKKYMSSPQMTTVNGIDVTYFVPFSSNNRSWFRDASLGTNITNNIAYLNSTYNNGTAINTGEVSLALSYEAVLKSILANYNLDVLLSPSVAPLLKDIFISCTGTKVVSMDYERVKITTAYNAFGSAPDWQLNYYPHTYQTSGGTFADPYLKVQYRALSQNLAGVQYKSLNQYVSITVRLTGVVTSSTNAVTATLRDLSNVEIAKPASGQVDSGVLVIKMKIEDTTFQSLGQNDSGGWDKFLKFNLYMKSVEPISWASCEFDVEYQGIRTAGGGEIYKGWKSFNNNNFPNFGAKSSNIDLFKSLPKMKVVDFLTSFFKMFNISVFDNDPLNDKLQWLTPSDINTVDKEYSKREVDYTDYVIEKKVQKNKEDDYDAYTFKHAKSKLIANDQFEVAYGEEFGAVYYPTLPNRVGLKINKELKVETNHTITGNTSVNGMTNIFTFYGFDSSNNPVNEALIFYIERTGSNIKVIDFSSQKVAIQNVKPDGTKESLPLSQYIPVNADRKADGIYTNSLTFSGTSVSSNSLFKMGYESFVARLLDFKALEHKFKLQIPMSEIYLNKRFENATPYGWRLQNDVIIEENKYSIINGEMNVKNGMLNLSLYNYTSNS
jgi:hypothetical protein